jgi:hypothetical protein
MIQYLSQPKAEGICRDSGSVQYLAGAQGWCVTFHYLEQIENQAVDFGLVIDFTRIV